MALLAFAYACLSVVSADDAPEPPAAPASPASRSALDALAGPAAPSDLDVMTFNLRYASDFGANTWAQRRPVMRTLLTDEQPDLIGTQEGLPDQLRDIAADLGPAYQHLGMGRDGGDMGEHMAIFFDTTRLRALSTGNFWLSATPAVPGSISWGSAHVRMVTWVLFFDRRTSRRFYAVNTHLDNMSENARRRGAELILSRISSLTSGSPSTTGSPSTSGSASANGSASGNGNGLHRGPLPVVLTGDFNSPAISPVHTLLTDHAGLRDTWLDAPLRGPAFATIHNYQPLIPDGERDDWILTTPGTTTLATLMNTYRRNGQYPSDHLPIQSRLRLP